MEQRHIEKMEDLRNIYGIVGLYNGCKWSLIEIQSKIFLDVSQGQSQICLANSMENSFFIFKLWVINMF